MPNIPRDWCKTVISLISIHWNQNKIVDILQTFSNAFPWIKKTFWISKISLKYVCSGLIDDKYCFREWFGTLQVTSHYLNLYWPICLTLAGITRPQWLNSLDPGRFHFNFRKVIFKLTGGWGISYEIALRWMPQDLTYDKSTLVQVMAWCRQATRHYLNQCWPRSMSPNGVTRPQWVNKLEINRFTLDLS